MTMSPPPYPEFPMRSPGRPAGVTPIAVIGIILGALAIFCLGCGGLLMIGQLNNPNMQHGHLTHGQLVQQMFFSIIALALAILLLSASIGALNLASWSRKALMVFAVLELILATYRFFYSVTTGLQQIMNGLENPTLPPNPTTQQAQGAQFIKAHAPFVRTGMIALSIGLFAIVVAYCVWILVVMRRQDVVDAFEGGTPSGPPPAYPPQQRY